MSMLEQNINIISEYPRHKIAEMVPDDLLYEYVCADGDEEFFTGKDGKVYLIKEEVDQQSLPDPYLRQLFIIVGIYSAGEIKTLIDNANGNSMFVIIEPNLSYFLYALENKDLDFLNRPNVVLIAQPPEMLPTILENTFLAGTTVLLAKNVRFYATYFYRHYDLDAFRQVIRTVSSALKFAINSIGNSVEDALIGTGHNFANLHQLCRSKDASLLKNALAGVPAIVVAAGPSLDKNIKLLKKAQGKAVILAVDTILQRLLDEGIIPHFVCTIERVEQTYHRYYQDKDIPEQVSLVAPLLLYPKTFEEFKGNVIIPFRTMIKEYAWLAKLIGIPEESFISMGRSCANVAFGFAAHLGASPIVLIGQDLAYAEDGKTHSKGTYWASTNATMDNMFTDSRMLIEGYYGNPVHSNEVWASFRTWFEMEIFKNKLNVINATEGGCRIKYTTQMPLQEVIDQYCTGDLAVSKVLDACPNYQIDQEKTQKELNAELAAMKQLVVMCQEYIKETGKLKLYPAMSSKQLTRVHQGIQKANDIFFAVTSHMMLTHILQSKVITSLWELYSIREELTYENLSRNRDITLSFAETIQYSVQRIYDMIEGALEKLITNSGLVKSQE